MGTIKRYDSYHRLPPKDPFNSHQTNTPKCIRAIFPYLKTVNFKDGSRYSKHTITIVNSVRIPVVSTG